MGLGRVVLAAVLAAGASTEVAKVDSSNYDLFLELAAQEEQWVLVDFFAPWCGHCKRLNPVLDEFVANTPGVRVAKVDATAEKALAEAHDVDGYPTLRFRAVGSAGGALNPPHIHSGRSSLALAWWLAAYSTDATTNGRSAASGDASISSRVTSQ